MKSIHKLKIRIALLLICLCCTSTVNATPKFPPPPDATVGRPGGDSMVVNGVAMDIRQFISSHSVEDVLQFYREFWPAGTEEKPGYTETDVLEPWQIITRVEDGYLMTVQVTVNGDSGSTGLLAMSKLPDPENMPTLGQGFPKMRGSYVINDISIVTTMKTAVGVLSWTSLFPVVIHNHYDSAVVIKMLLLSFTRRGKAAS